MSQTLVQSPGASCAIQPVSARICPVWKHVAGMHTVVEILTCLVKHACKRASLVSMHGMGHSSQDNLLRVKVKFYAGSSQQVKERPKDNLLTS